ncbi:MAG TPA: hypothetical protein PLW11_11030, partial [Bacillota bacterium]|nr:hypothetical protein [Bacillota bacterium]
MMKGKLKKPIAFLMTLLLIFNMGFTAFADVPSNHAEGPGVDITSGTGGEEVKGDNPEAEDPDNTEGNGEEGGDPDNVMPGDEGEGEEQGEEQGGDPEDPPAEEAPAAVKAYEIRYLVESIEEPVPGLETVQDSGEVGATIEIAQPEVEGYQVLAAQPTELVISENDEENIVTVYYEEVVEVEEPAGPTVLTAVVDGVTITVTAEAGVIPEGTSLNVVKLSDEEYELYVGAIEENEGVYIA